MSSKLQQVKQQREADGRSGAGEGVPEAVLLRRNRQLEALYAVARTVNASLDLGDVLQQALEQVLGALEFPSGVIRLLDAPTGELSLAARAGLTPELEKDLSRTVRLGEGPSGLAAQRRSLVVLDDLTGSSFRQTVWARHGYRTFVAVPLQCRGMLLGCMNIASPESRTLDESDRELLLALANQVGMALANAELYTAAERKIQYLSGLHQFSRDVGPAPDLDRVLRLTTERMAQLLGLNRTVVLFWSSETRELHGAASFPPLDEITHLRVPAAEGSAVAVLLRSGEPVLSSDPVGERLLPAEFVQVLGLQTVLAVPLVAHDQIMGLLVGGRTERSNDGSSLPVQLSLAHPAGRSGSGRDLLLSADETELAMIFAHKAALWITNARLFVQEHEARSHAEAAETRFRGLLESAPDGIVCVDGEGRIALLNTQMERLFGYSRDELLGQPVELLMPARFRSAHAGHRVRYGDDPHTRPMGAGLELLGRRRDGSEFPLEISLSPLQTPQGPLVTAAVRDITERKQAQDALERQAQELARSNAELEQFAYVASHDLQEPLRMVSSYTQLIAKRYRGKLDSDADEFIAFAVDGVNRMQQLIHDLLAYSRVRTKGKEFEPTDCARIVEDVLVNLQAAVAESGAIIACDPLPTLMADASQLTQLFQNLIANAIKFHREASPCIYVGAEQTADGWLFTVRDNGIGLETEYAARIFLIFQRLHIRAEYPGTGIGLAICKRIVERHGGRIWVESRPGEGSAFHFTIPERQEVSS
jgi:PAS domain S-box-containing protein